MTRRIGTAAPIAALCVVMLASLMMLSEAVQDSARFGRLYLVLLAINAVGLLAFIVLIAVNGRRLFVQLRRREPGSRLTLRLLGFFSALAVIPLVVLYGFSLHYLRQGIDSWFDVRVQQALRDSLELSRAALDIRMRELNRLTHQVADEIGEVSAPMEPLNLDLLRAPGSTVVANVPSSGTLNIDALRQRAGAHEMMLVTTRGGLIASSSIDATQVVPSPPSAPILLQIQQGRSYIGLDPIRDRGLYVRIAVPVRGRSSDGERRVLQALYPVTGRMNELAQNVEAAFVKYTELAYLREQLRISFTMSLTLVLLFSVLSAVGAAFHFARRLTAPIRDLADGTDQVARGNYETTLPVTSHDELGFLVQSFNEMTRRIAAARDEARRSRDEVDTQRSYLATVLGRLSSGVLTLDAEGRVRTANPSALEILRIDDRPLEGRLLAEVAADLPALAPFAEAIAPHLAGDASEWQVEVQMFGVGGRQALICRGAVLPSSGPAPGHVIVFDDITALVRAQRNAAWSEAARRLAHEIKNPLTPIQLSAERLRRKYLGTMQAKDADTLDRLTNTIVQQVETMKGMVNAFSDYARPPKMQAQPLQINALVEEVAELFRSMNGPRIALALEPGLPELHADPGRLRQILNNVIKNAIEGTPEDRTAEITIGTRAVRDTGAFFVELRVDDQGDGVPAQMLATIFDPYVTSKPKGTGLGLAIVRKIVEEHGGIVWMENKPNRGACVIIRLPVNNRAAEGARNLHKDAV
ncbi:MAG: ATP-binding protein [Gammaproteobacteria bacterium]